MRSIAGCLGIEAGYHPLRKVNVDALQLAIGERGIIEVEVLAHVLARVECEFETIDGFCLAHNALSPSLSSGGPR